VPILTLFGKPEPTLVERLKESVSKTRSQLAGRVEELLTGEHKIDPALLAELEKALLSADLGVRTTREILAAVREKVDRQTLSDAKQLKTELKSQLAAILNAPPAKNGAPEAAPSAERKPESAACWRSGHPAMLGAARRSRQRFLAETQATRAGPRRGSS